MAAASHGFIFDNSDGGNMKFTPVERMILINQFRILERLYPDDGYEVKRKILENGYTLNYKWLMLMDEEEMPEEDCRFVFDVLDMFRAIHNSDGNIPFKGFDGNYEPDFYGYASFLIMDEKKYQELVNYSDYPDVNSHTPMADKYRRMLTIWKENGSPQEIDKELLEKLARG